jgi:hypothetical protein
MWWGIASNVLIDTNKNWLVLPLKAQIQFVMGAFCLLLYATVYCIIHARWMVAINGDFVPHLNNLGDITHVRWVVIMLRPFLPYGISSTRLSSCVYGVTCSIEFILCFHKHKMKILFNKIENWAKILLHNCPKWQRQNSNSFLQFSNSASTLLSCPSCIKCTNITDTLQDIFLQFYMLWYHQHIVGWAICWWAI